MEGFFQMGALLAEIHLAQMCFLHEHQGQGAQRHKEQGTAGNAGGKRQVVQQFHRRLHEVNRSAASHRPTTM
ncbi:MAG: hypothetical protein A3J99_03975 [Sideroxydans sp. RIFOXYD2_FULL_59_7]|nr:MAG: hypothetical protein A3J99_03975 [Sideroxydans sp. RIFOXYD2_FULL_59_7]